MDSVDENDCEEASSSDDDYMPSISDQLCVGYGKMDRAAQTKVSEIENSKEVTSVLTTLVNDVMKLERALAFAQVNLKAKYDSTIESNSFHLYELLNEKVADLQKRYNEQVDIVRRCYRSQLANAISKLSKDYHYFYGNKDAVAELSHKKKLKEMERQQEIARRNEVAQREMLEMVKMQMEEAANKPSETPSRKSSVISLSVYTEEIEELKNSIREYESRIVFLEDSLEEANADNGKLNAQLGEANLKFQQEHNKVIEIAQQMRTLRSNMEQERKEAKEMMKNLQIKHEEETKKQIAQVRNNLQNEAAEKLEALRRSEMEKLNRQKFLDQQRLKELEAQHEKEKQNVPEPIDVDLSRLQQIEMKQRIEIARLQKEIEQITKMYEMKVRVLTEQIHALKDEMFLRTTLQRQAAKFKQAALAYMRKGSLLTPLGIVPTNDIPEASTNKPIIVDNSPKKRQLPKLIQPPQGMKEVSGSSSPNVAS